MSSELEPTLATVTTALVLGACGWLAALTVLARVARRTGSRRLARTFGRAAPQPVRRVVELLVAGSAVLGIAAPAVAAPGPPVVDEPVVRTPAPAPAPPPARSPRVEPAPTPRAAPASHEYVVRPGDNLWRIARTELVARGSADPADAVVARYWREVISANRSTLRSGDPSLIFPGEIVALPESA